MSDMARIPLELGLRADANWFHDARRATGINNRQTGPQHDKRNCKGTSSVSTRHGQQSTCRRRAFQGACVGALSLTRRDTPITIPPHLRKPQELLQALIAFGGTEVSAGLLIDALWPDSEGDAAYHALESGLYRLRQLLGARDAVRMEGGKVSLNRDQLWVDM